MATGQQWWLDRIGRIPLLTPAEEIELGNAIQAWRNHPGFPDSCPPGIRRRGQRARERFVSANLRLAVHFVTQRCHRLLKAHAVDDLIQAGNEGLIKAVERFDPTRGYRFSTYAIWWIRQSVGGYCDRHSRVVAIPGSHHQHLGRLGPAIRQLQRELGRDPTREEIAAAIGVSMRVLEQLMINAQPVSSLDQQVSDDGMVLADLIASDDPSLEEREEQEERWRQVEQLRGMVARLPAADRELLTLAYGLDGEQRTPQQVAAAVGHTTRAVEHRLRELEAQLRGMAVQLVLLAVPLQAIPANAIRRATRRRRVKVAVGQLSLELEPAAPWPTPGAAALARVVPAVRRPAPPLPRAAAHA